MDQMGAAPKHDRTLTGDGSAAGAAVRFFAQTTKIAWGRTGVNGRGSVSSISVYCSSVKSRVGFLNQLSLTGPPRKTEVTPDKGCGEAQSEGRGERQRV